MSSVPQEPMAANSTAISLQHREDGRRVVIEWIMSSVCNYTCSYCPTYLHDGRPAARPQRHRHPVAFHE